MTGKITGSAAASPDDAVGQVALDLHVAVPDVRDAPVVDVLHALLTLQVALPVAVFTVSDWTISIVTGTLNGKTCTNGQVIFRLAVL